VSYSGRRAAADGSTRIEYRDLIAQYGGEAIKRLKPWLGDARLAAFAVASALGRVPAPRSRRSPASALSRSMP